MEEMTDEEARDKDEVGERMGEVQAKPSRNSFPCSDSEQTWHKQGKIEVLNQEWYAAPPASSGKSRYVVVDKVPEDKSKRPHTKKNPEIGGGPRGHQGPEHRRGGCLSRGEQGNSRNPAKPERGRGPK